MIFVVIFCCKNRFAEQQQEQEARAHDDDDDDEGILQDVAESAEVHQLQHKLEEITLELNELRDTVS